MSLLNKFKERIDEGKYKDTQAAIAKAHDELTAFTKGLQDSTLEMLMQNSADKTANAELGNLISDLKRNSPELFNILKMGFSK